MQVGKGMAGGKRRFKLRWVHQAREVSIEWRRMSRHTLFNGLSLVLQKEISRLDRGREKMDMEDDSHADFRL